MQLMRQILLVVIAWGLPSLWMTEATAAFTILEVRSSEFSPRIVVDGGYSQGLLIGTLLEVYRFESLTSEDTQANRRREVFVAKALVVESEQEWCLAEPVGIPIEPLKEAQQVRMKVHNTVRYVTGSDRNALLDLNAAMAQELRTGDTLEVLRPMKAIHPVTQAVLEWLDPIGKIQIDHVTPHLFTARGYVTESAKPVLAGDRLIRSGEITSGIHVLRVLEDGLYVNRFPDALPGTEGTLRTVAQPDAPAYPFRIGKVYERLVELALPEAHAFTVGEPVRIQLLVETSEETDRETP